MDEIDLWGLDQLLGTLRKIGQQGEPAVKDRLRIEAQSAYNLSQELVPVRRGWLRRSGRVREWKRGFNIIYDAPHARLVHDGNQRHPRGGQRHFLQEPIERLAAGGLWDRCQIALNEVIADAGKR